MSSSRPGLVRCYSILFLILMLGAALNASPPSSSGVDMPQMANQMAQMHHVWGASLNSPGALLTLKETNRSGGIVSYRLVASGLDHNKHYSLVSWPVTQREPSAVMDGVTLDDTGLAVCAGKAKTDCGSPEKPNDPIDLKIQPTKGEPFRIALISSDDKKLKAFVKTVPIPNESSDKSCTVQSVLLLAGGAEVAIEGSGFPANADLSVEINSAGERHAGNGKADADGKYFSAILPYKQGLTHGTTEVRLKSAACSPSVTFDWGQ